MDKETNVVGTVNQIGGRLTWTSFISTLVSTKPFKTQEILHAIISNNICDELRDNATFVYLLKEFLINELRKMYGRASLTSEFYAVVREIKNCHYFVAEEVLQLMQILPDSPLSMVE